MKKLLYILSIVLSFLCSCEPVFGQNFTGTGTATDPYIILTPVGLDSVRYLFTGTLPDTSLHFQLGNDIDMTTISNFDPMGDISKNFYGVFDGKGYTIRNLHITSLHNSYAGLFGAPSEGWIQNLNMENCSVILNGDLGVGEKSIGILAGYLDDYSNVKNIRIIDCTIKINSTAFNTSLNIGGIAGKALGTAYQCAVESINIIDTMGTVVCHAGLFIGLAQGISIDQCYATGHLVVISTSSFGVLGIPQSGLFLGKSTNDEVGWARHNNYAIGSMITSDATSGFTIDGDDNFEYAVDTLTAPLKVGFNWNTNGVNNTTCYFDSNSVGTSIANNTGSNGANPVNQTALKNQSTFTGWDFANTWGISPLINNGFPYLKWAFIPTVTSPVASRYTIGDVAIIKVLDPKVDTFKVYIQYANNYYDSVKTFIGDSTSITLDSLSNNAIIKLVANNGITIYSVSFIIESIKILILDTVYFSSSNINLGITIKGITAFQAFYSIDSLNWTFINNFSVSNISLHTETLSTFMPFPMRGDGYFKIKEFTDTSTYDYTPAVYLSGYSPVVNPGQICYDWAYSDLGAVWRRDLGCGWVSNIQWTTGISTVTISGIGIPTVHPSITTYSPGIKPPIPSGSGSPFNNTSASSPYTINGRQFWWNNKNLYQKDLVNDITTVILDRSYAYGGGIGNFDGTIGVLSRGDYLFFAAYNVPDVIVILALPYPPNLSYIPISSIFHNGLPVTYNVYRNYFRGINPKILK